jgi:aspartokinase
MFQALADRGMNIQAISTSEIKINVLTDEMRRTRGTAFANGL